MQLVPFIHWFSVYIYPSLPMQVVLTQIYNFFLNEGRSTA